MTPPDHYILTRSVYDPRLWTDPDEISRRLDIFAASTVSSLRANALDLEGRGLPLPTWLVTVHPDDPNLPRRRELVAYAGLPFEFRYTADPAAPTRPEAALAAYRTAWALPWVYQLLTTRIDDDDAFAANAFARLYTRHTKTAPTDATAYIFPNGHRVYGGRFTVTRHETNAWATLWTPPGDDRTVYTVAHRKVKTAYPVIFIDDRPGWLWVRHPDTLSGWAKASKPLTDPIRRLYPVDWNILDPARRPTVPDVPGGSRFR